MLKIWMTAFMIYRSLSPDYPEVCGMDLGRLVEQLKLHEGVELLPYEDAVGKMTIGIGRNLTDNGISIATAEQMLMEDISRVETELNKVYPEWCDLSENRQLVLADMAFNLGIPRYLLFTNFWAALGEGDYDVAADEMLDSIWANQVGERAVRLAGMMRDG